jgi:hypothetical protein
MLELLLMQALVVTMKTSIRHKGYDEIDQSEVSTVVTATTDRLRTVVQRSGSVCDVGMDTYYVRSRRG